MNLVEQYVQAWNALNLRECKINLDEQHQTFMILVKDNTTGEFSPNIGINYSLVDMPKMLQVLKEQLQKHGKFGVYKRQKL